MENNGSNKDWRNFEKRRQDALRAGYGQSPATPYQHPSVVQTSSANIGWQPDSRGTVPVSSVYRSQVPPPVSQTPPFSYANGAHASPATWNSPNQGGVTANEQFSHPSKSTAEDEFEGPLKKRKCRDVICLALFAVFLGLMAFVAAYALWTGDLNRLVPGGTESKCHSVGSPDVLKAIAINEGLLPHDDFNLISNSSIDQGFFNKVASEFTDNWPNVIFMCLIALGLSIVMTVFLRLFAGTIIWTVIILFVLCSVIATIALWIVFARTKNAPDGKFWDTHRRQMILGIASVVTICTVLILLVLLVMRRRIALVARLFKEAGKAVHAIPLVLIQPVYTFICQAFAGVVFVSLAVLIETSETYDSTTNECNKSGFAKTARWLNIFGYFWMTQFIIGCQHLVVAGAISQWFFTRNKSKLSFPLLTSFKNLVRYHLGSIAFGSAIIAVLKFVRFLLNQLKQRLGGASKIAAVLLCCCQCCLWCLEKFLTFLNRNAYIEIAIYGYGFCPSAKRAFKVITSNALRLVAINSIGDFVLFLAKITIVGVTVLCGYYIFQHKAGENNTLDTEWVLITIGAAFAYYIAHCFISIYEMAIDTIFICFCEDCEMNDGVTRQYFMSKGLMEFVKISRKHDKKGKKSAKED